MSSSEEAMREQQERLLQDTLDYANNIIATLREPFLVLSKDLRVKSANQEFYKTFQISPEETENQFVYDLGNRQWDIPALRTLLGEVLSNNEPIHDYEVEHDFPSIGRRIMQLNARRIRQPSNHSELILLSIEDITERRHAEEAKFFLASIVESSEDSIVTVNFDGRITSWNKGAERVYGYPAVEAVGKPLNMLIFSKDLKDLLSNIDKIQHGEKVEIFDTVRLNKDGQEINLEIIMSPVKDASGQIIGVSTFARDITRRVQLERQTQEQAEALADQNRRKDEFLAMLSHELRNPLSPILSALHILKLGPSESPLQQQARTVIERQVGQLTHLIEDLLEITRVSTGRIQLHLERLDVGHNAKLAVESVQPMIASRKHELSMSLPSEPVWIQADPARLEQVMVNLLNNAAKYTDEGGHIWLTVEQEGNEAVLRVRDSGVGIAPELLPHIFDLFSQGERSLDRSQGGLGIGLSLVQRLVELHRGTVEAHSEGLGKGSEFTVRLPVLFSPVTYPPTPPEETLRQAAMPGRVLVVDDNVDVADMVSILLQASGYEVRVAYTAQTALETAIESQPNIVLLDIGLPDIDGYEVARRLRQRPQLKDVKLVAITGYGREVDRQRSQEAGFDYHLVKPVDPIKLEALLVTLAKH
jgi:PAS domain S-box-containing protein